MLLADDLERLSRFLAGELEPQEEAALRAQLEKDPELAAAVRQLEALDVATERLSRQPHGLDVERAIAKALMPRRRRWPLLAVAAVVVISAAGWWATRDEAPAPAPEVIRTTQDIASVQVLPETEHVEEGTNVSRLISGTALYSGDWLVITPERTLEIHGKALISTNPSHAIAHVTSLATFTPEESDMIRIASMQWSLINSLAVLTLSGVAVADAPVKAGQTWVAKGPAAPAVTTVTKDAAVEPKHECTTCKPEGEDVPGPAQDVKVGNSPSLGPADAKVTVVLFSEAECSFCVKSHGVLKELQKTYGTRVRFVFKQFPLPRHAGARQAALALHAANGQGKFWDMLEAAFGEPVSSEGGLYDAQARRLGMDLQQYRRDVSAPATAAVIDADIAEGKRLGVQGVPAWYINGRQVQGHRPFETMQKFIDAELAK